MKKFAFFCVSFNFDFFKQIVELNLRFKNYYLISIKINLSIKTKRVRQ